jgi:hypothetical protein
MIARNDNNNKNKNRLVTPQPRVGEAQEKDRGRKRERCDRSVQTVLSNKRPKRTSDILSEVFQKLLFLPAFQLHRFSISLF